MEWTERQYYRLWEKFKNHHYRNRGSNRKKRLRHHFSRCKVVKAVKITKEVRTDTLAANTATVYIVQKGITYYYRSEEHC
jgi:hypothetical protein